MKIKNCGDFLIYLQALVNELWLIKKKKGQNGQIFYSRITRQHERKVRQTSRVAP